MDDVINDITMFHIQTQRLLRHLHSLYCVLDPVEVGWECGVCRCDVYVSVIMLLVWLTAMASK